MATITKTIKPSLGDYTSLSNWEAGEQTDLVAAGNVAEAECYSMEDTAYSSLNGWTTSETCYVRIKGADSDRTSSNTGKWSTDRYRLVVTDLNGASVLENYLGFVHIENIQFSGASIYESGEFRAIFNRAYAISGAKFYISGCIIQATTVGTARRVVALLCWSSSYVYNNIIYNVHGPAETVSQFIQCENDNGVSYVYNNTLIGDNTGTGIANANANASIVINNLIYNMANPAIGTFAAGTDYNVTDDASIGYTVTGEGNTHDHASHTFSFVDAGANDYHLSPTDVGAIGLGLTDPGSGLFSDDIDGVTRTVPWDIGADQHSSTGVTGISVNIAGEWKAVTAISINIAGVWEDASNLSVNAGGTWKQRI